ncbi:RbcX protein [Synechococcus sp. PCC 7335]|uniref:RuBisCO chaperone RbcX n=1 Tax=Synechococcus sp. (strain ATCC 29403 / PCC 7335) TaxID=91464 RepID=UPI00017EB4C9|nr:chaperonin family protein RbcX [Synechococcus sp. PCC 7335]EDX84105.1 RbcX protein [Synechococcus sp. PCC 7335]
MADEADLSARFPQNASSMDLKRIAKDTAQVLKSYLTYQAVRIVLGQLKETNLPRHRWLHEFSSREKLQDGEAYIKSLFREAPDLALRVMTVRLHVAEEVSEFLPEMVTTQIQQANIEHRKKHLEKITQMTSEELAASVDKLERGNSKVSEDTSSFPNADITDVDTSNPNDADPPDKAI